MSKRVSQLKEFLKLMNVNSVNNIKLTMSVWYDYTNGGTADLDIIGKLGSYSTNEFGYLKGCKVYTIKYQPESLTTSNMYNSHSETFKYSNCIFSEVAGSAELLITKDILKELDNKVTIDTYVNGD